MPVFQWLRYYYMSAFEYNPINHCHIISKCPWCPQVLWIWSLFSGQPLIILSLSCCRWSSCEVACCNCCITMQSGMFVVVYMASTFNCMSGISSSIFSLWFCLESHLAMNRSGPGLFMILTLYLCILRRIHCILWDSIATSFLKIATSALWSVIILTYLAKQ